MDTTVTTKNQSPHRLLSCESDNSINNNTNSDPLNITKNKRKNFNPRCSSASADEDDDDCSIIKKKLKTKTTASIPLTLKQNLINENVSEHRNNDTNQIIFDKISKDSQQQIAFEAMSINWRKILLENHQQTISETNMDDIVKNTTNMNEIITTTDSMSNETQTTTITTSTINNCENKFYNIPNTNFSIAKSAALNLATNITNHQDIATQQSIKMLNSDGIGNSDNNIVSEQQHINVATAAAAVAAAAVSSSSSSSAVTGINNNNPQARLEFACNAFNAVQELLNVYALSLSPGDIVDAFRRQMIGEFIFFIIFLYIPSFVRYIVFTI